MTVSHARVRRLAALRMAISATLAAVGLATAERQRVARHSRQRCLQLAAGGHEPEVARDLCLMARQVQDVLFLSRKRAPRVPSWFFGRYREQDSSDFTAGLVEARRGLARAGLRPPGRGGRPDRR